MFRRVPVICPVAGVLAGLAVFLIWRWLVGPSLHWVESLVGLALAAGAGLGLYGFLARRLRR